MGSGHSRPPFFTKEEIMGWFFLGMAAGIVLAVVALAIMGISTIRWEDDR